MKNTSKMTFLLLILLIASMASTCQREDENCHTTINFSNHSDKSIYVVESYKYPDTLNVQGIRHFALSHVQWNKIEPNPNGQNRTALQKRSCWESTFKNRWEIPSDTLIVYVFDAEFLELDIITNADDNTINAIIQRYDLSLQDLQHVNWTLTYPPSPNMSAIKMYPPYGH